MTDARCLQPNPRLRYENAATLAAALREATSQETVRVKRRKRRGSKLDIARVALALAVPVLLGALFVLLCH